MTSELGEPAFTGNDPETGCSGRCPTSRPRPATSDHPTRMGFFTDTSVCIGCKACEVACKEWNTVPRRRLRDTSADGHVLRQHRQLGANTWRHVAFVEQRAVDLPMPDVGLPGAHRQETPEPDVGHRHPDSRRWRRAACSTPRRCRARPADDADGDREIRWLM